MGNAIRAIGIRVAAARAVTVVRWLRDRCGCAGVKRNAAARHDTKQDQGESDSGDAEGFERHVCGSPVRRFASAHEESLVLISRKLLHYLEFVADEKSRHLPWRVNVRLLTHNPRLEDLAAIPRSVADKQHLCAPIPTRFAAESNRPLNSFATLFRPKIAESWAVAQKSTRPELRIGKPHQKEGHSADHLRHSTNRGYAELDMPEVACRSLRGRQAIPL